MLTISRIEDSSVGIYDTIAVASMHGDDRAWKECMRVPQRAYQNTWG